MYDPSEIPMPHRAAGELESKPPQWVDQVARTIPALPSTSIDPSLPGGVESAYGRFPEEKTRRMLAAYYGQVSHVDTQVGRLIDALERRGVYDNTLIIFLSDHGDYCGNNWAFYKYAGLYDSLIRVPLVVRWPHQRPQGRSIRDLVSLIDIAPTILDAAEVEAPGPMDGRSLKPMLCGERVDWRDEVFVESGATTAVVTEEWKLVRWRDGTEEVYNRREDPHDLENLAGRASVQQIQAGLGERIECWRDEPGCRLRF